MSDIVFSQILKPMSSSPFHLPAGRQTKPFFSLGVDCWLWPLGGEVFPPGSGADVPTCLPREGRVSRPFGGLLRHRRLLRSCLKDHLHKFLVGRPDVDAASPFREIVVVGRPGVPPKEDHGIAVDVKLSDPFLGEQMQLLACKPALFNASTKMAKLPVQPRPVRVPRPVCEEATGWVAGHQSHEVSSVRFPPLR